VADAGVDSGAAPNSCGAPAQEPAAAEETCGNGLDDDHNGFIDEGCSCTSGATQPCFGGPIARAAAPECTKGTQTCVGEEFTGWKACEGWSCGPTTPPPERCDNHTDDDCDARIDEGCVLDVPVNIDGDCIAVSCPPQAPYPVGCDLTMEGEDARGCVANVPGSSSVYFQEGDACPLPPPFDFGGAGHVSGTLLCSTVLPAGPLGADSCTIHNKAQPIYAMDRSGCPQP
jgi:hypothetical protein